MNWKKKLQELYKKEKDLRTEAKGILDTCVKENRNPNDDEKTKLKDVNGKLEDCLKEIEEARLMAGFDDNETRLKDLSRPGRPTATAPQAKGWGDAFLESINDDERFKAWAESGAKGNSPRIMLKNVQSGAAEAQGGALVRPERIEAVTLGWRAFRVLDFLPKRPTGSNAIEVPKQVSRTNNAEFVPEPTATNNAANLKPESDTVWDLVTYPIYTVAHMIPASRQILADAPQMRAIIDGELRNGLLDKVERRIFNGTGNGGQWTGLNNMAGVQAQAFDTDILTTTRKALTKLTVAGTEEAEYVPQAWFMNPTDWEQFDLLQNADGIFYYGGPTRQGQPMLWGYPVVLSTAVTVGSPYIGDWRQFPLYDRQEPAVYFTDSNRDWFERNLLAFLGEFRGGFVDVRTNAAVKVDITE
jgi:HK97 family phage major capsid protein